MIALPWVEVASTPMPRLACACTPSPASVARAWTAMPASVDASKTIPPCPSSSSPQLLPANADPPPDSTVIFMAVKDVLSVASYGSEN